MNRMVHPLLLGTYDCVKECVVLVVMMIVMGIPLAVMIGLIIVNTLLISVFHGEAIDSSLTLRYGATSAIMFIIEIFVVLLTYIWATSIYERCRTRPVQLEQV